VRDSATPHRYEIRVGGVLDQRWSDWFAGLEIGSAGEDTVISGLLPDQAALHGVLNRIRDLDLFLISVESSDTGGPLPPA
jgi:hypothetical protein